MRICIILPSLCVGGSTNVALNLAEQYSKQHEVLFVVLKRMNLEKYTEFFASNKIKFVCLNRKHKFGLIFLLKLKRVLKKFNPDCVHSHLSATFYTSLVTKKPIIHTIHADPILDLPRFMQLYLKKQINKHNDRIKFVSCSRMYSEKASEIYNTNVPYILNGIKLENNVKDYSYRDKEFDFLFVGRFSKEKNILFLIECFKEVLKLNSNLSLCICGIGDMERAISNFVKENELERNITIIVKPDNVMHYYNHSKIFCLFSLREGAPIVILEAMSVGMPILFSNVPGMSNYLKNDINGEAIDLSSSEKSAKIMFEMINNRKKTAVYSRNNYRDVLQFTIEKTASEYEEIMKKFYE